MRLSDSIESFIKDLLNQESTEVELKRNELAEYFGCAPSQINYVLATRFSPDHGYLTESRRGGGGYIRITRVRTDPEMLVMHTVNAVGDEIDRSTTAALISNLLDSGAIDNRTARLLLAATGDAALRPVDPAQRDRARAGIFKQMLIKIL